ncbi:MAG: glucose-1-phosphate thymidylyltransferase RfbA [Flavobacteriaceae bacterium]|nr:glucose-1-phosphate thymidylyltransferase RfbA [Flavobacteriaceae bacterium]
MKGIILAGGLGTRLYPITKVISKQLLSVYDKPMIYYPLSLLMMSEIREILIISTPKDLPMYKNLLGDGRALGLKLSYEEQSYPNGLAQAFVIGEKFIGKDNVCLVLGDNIFYGQGFSSVIRSSIKRTEKEEKATIFGFYVKDPERYGVVSFNSSQEVTKIEEKPVNPKSNYAVVGLYFYPNKVIEVAKEIKLSERGEYEITEVNNIFLSKKKLYVELMDKEFVWLDTGTHDSLLEASNFIQAIEKRQGLKIACLEEIALKKGFINKLELKKVIKPIINTEYGKYLKNKNL